MKQSFLTTILVFIFANAFSQVVTTGKIDSLKDGWDVTTTYIGELKNGKPNGLGMAIYSTASTALRYVGNFVNGKYEGKGVLMYKEGNFSSGDWKGGLLNGQGASYNKDKDLYIGGFAKGVKSGKGIYFFKDNGFGIGSFKNDQYNGRIIYVGKSGTTICDNMYVDNKKEGQGYQYEFDNKKLFEGIWRNDSWDKASTGNYYSFLKNSKFYASKTDETIMAGSTNPTSKLLEDTSFVYYPKDKKRQFGVYSKGYLDDGIIITDSTRLKATINDQGAYGKGHFLKIDKYYDEGNYVKDYLNGDNSLSINIASKTVYFGKTIDSFNMTGKAWFSDNTNQLFNGDFVNGQFTGNGWRLDKTGYCVKGKWKNGSISSVTALYNEKGEQINIAPKTFSEALTTVCNAYPTEYFGLEGAGDYYESLGSLDLLFYKSLISFPGGSIYDLIGEDYDYYGHYISIFKETDKFDEAKNTYDYLCNEVKKASVKLKKGGAPLKFSGDIVKADDSKSFIISQFSLPASEKGYTYFGVSVIMKKDSDGQYIVFLAAGDKSAEQEWDK